MMLIKQPSTEPALSRQPTGTHAARRGAALVEFAVVAPVMFMMILAMIELGRGFMVSHLLTNAARRGCRVGVVEGKSNADIVAAVATALNPVGINSDAVTVQVNDNSGDVANAQPGDELTVVVSVPTSSVSWVPFLRYLPSSLSGQYTLRRE
jgi:Flp pilus assembly protein TadG